MQVVTATGDTQLIVGMQQQTAVVVRIVAGEETQTGDMQMQLNSAGGKQDIADGEAEGGGEGGRGNIVYRARL